MNTAVIALREFANANRLCVAACNHQNVNVGETALLQVKLNAHGHQLTIRAAKSLFACQLRLSRRAFCFSVNQPDYICVLKTPLPRARSLLAWPVFVGNLNDEQVVSDWFSKEVHRRSIAAFSFRKNESLQIYLNGIVAIVDFTRNLASVVENVAALAMLLPPGHSRSNAENYGVLPQDLRHLQRFFAKWALSDDVARSEIVARSRMSQRETLRLAVAPLLPRINAYLDSIRGPLPECAVRLQCIAELVAELQIKQ